MVLGVVIFKVLNMATPQGLNAVPCVPDPHPRPLLVHDRAPVADELVPELLPYGDREELRSLELLRDQQTPLFPHRCWTCHSS